MSNFILYSSFLNEDDAFSLNCGIEEATKLLDDFNSDDWDTLSKTWKHKSENWQINCAMTLSCLSGKSAKFGLSILLNMLDSESNEVIKEVLDSLTETVDCSDNFSLNVYQLSKIKRIRNKSAIIKMMVSILLEKID